MAQDLRSLAEGIAGAHQAREEALNGIRSETAEMMEEFRRLGMERQSEITRMKKDVAGTLAAFRKERERDAAAWHDIISGLRTKKTGEAVEAVHARKKKKPAKATSGE
jgi:hypothetical protein